MKRFSKNDNSAICNYCGKWQPTDLTNQQLEEMDWKCAECKAKESPAPASINPPEQDRGSKEVSKYDPEYEFLVKLIQLITKEGVPPQEVKALAEAHPFVTIDDVGDLAAQIWTLATEKYHIPREWLIKKLPKNASLKQAGSSLLSFVMNDEEMNKYFQERGINLKKEFPKLKINYSDKPLPGNAYYDGNTQQIYVNRKLPIEDIRETLEHEIEHALQDKFNLPKDKPFVDKNTPEGPDPDQATFPSEWGADLAWVRHLKNKGYSLEEIYQLEIQKLTRQHKTKNVSLNQDFIDRIKQLYELSDNIDPQTIVSKKADLKEYSNEATQMVNEYIIKHPPLMRGIVAASQSSENEELFERYLIGVFERTRSFVIPEIEEQTHSKVQWNELAYAWFHTVKRDLPLPGSAVVDIEKLPMLDKKKKLDDLLDAFSVETDPQKKEKIKQHIERIKRAKLLKANNTYDEEWQAQKETEDMIDHAPGYLAYDYGQDKTADGEFKGSEFSGTDDAPNPLTDIGPWSSPEDHGAKPQKSPFPNTNWLPASDENLDQQAPSNVAASLKKEAIQQQDVVDFYLLSLLPPQYLNQEVSPDHYDALSIFKGIIESLRNEYIIRGMEELVDEAETTAWTKAIPEDDMPEQIKKYYTFHDGPFPGRNYHSDPDDEDYDSEPNYDSTCDNCGTGLYEDEVYNFNDGIYCIDCEGKAIQDAIKENVAFCETHKVFVTDDRNLKEHLHGYKFDSWDKHHDNGVCNVVRFDAGKQIWQEMEENAKNQLQMELGDRKKRREEKPKQMKLRPDDGTAPNQLGGDDDPIPGPTASLHKQADEGWWEAPTHFGEYTPQDFYTIFKYAPWKHMYGGPAWAEIAKTIYDMQRTIDWQKLVVLIDHFHDLGHNTGKLLDKFPEWHQWFKKLLDMKAKKNSIRYLLPKASKSVQSLVTDFLRVHGRDWREDEETKKKELPDTKFHKGEEVIADGRAATIREVSRMDLEKPLYAIVYEDGKSRWAQDDELQAMPAVHSSLNRPFSKKANPNTRYWIAPDGTEFPVSGIHPIWIDRNHKILNQYGFKDSFINTHGRNDLEDKMYDQGWTRISNEPAGRGFQIQIANLNSPPSYLDNFISRNFKQGDTILIGDGHNPGIEVTDPFPNIQKAINKAQKFSKQAAINGQVTNTILQSIHDNGGTTYNLTNGDMVGTPNFSVSIYPDRERIVDGVDFDVLEDFIVNNEDLLKDPTNSFGAWTNNGKVYLDVVITTPDQEKAIDLAKQNNQIAIWDLQHGREISTGGMTQAFSKKSLIKKAEESTLTQDAQNAIAAASSPAYVIAVNNYAEALKRGHSKDRSLEYAVQSVQNLEKVDPKKLVEFVNEYVVI